MSLVDLEKALDRVPRRVVERAMRDKGIPKVMVKALLSLYEEKTTRIKIGSGYSYEFPVKVGVHQGSVSYYHRLICNCN